MSLRAVVLSVRGSPESRRAASDPAVAAIIEELPAVDGVLIHRQAVAAVADTVREAIRAWLDRAELILLTGGTGVGPAAVTPEAVAPLIDQALPGFGEAMRQRGISPDLRSVAWRCGAGIAGDVLVVWLPDEPTHASDCLVALAPAIRHVCAELGRHRPAR